MKTAQATRTPLRSIAEWCADQNISVSLYYKLRTEGRSPEVMKIGRRCLITEESDRRWQAMMKRDKAAAA